MHRHEYDMVFERTGTGFDTVQNSGMQGMQERPIAQDETNHLRPAPQDPPGLCVGSKSKFLHYCGNAI
jgi:hypothetical protein